MTGYLRELSIRSKLIVAMFMASFTTLVLVTVVVLIWDNKNLENAATENASAITQSLTQNFLKMQFLDSSDAVSDVVTTLRSFQEINQVFLFNNAGEPVFQYHKQNTVRSEIPDINSKEILNVGPEYIHIVQPILFGGQEYGKAYLKLSKGFINQWKETQRNRFLYFIIVVSGMAVLMARMVAPLIARPIIELAQTMEHVVNNKDLTIRVETDEKREIAQLYNGFNEMLSAIERYSKDLQNHKYAIDQSAIVSITNLMGRITYVNEKFIEVSGYDREELIGQNHRIVKSDVHDDKFFKKLWSTISKGNVWNGEICNRAKDGSYYWVDSTMVPFLDNKGKPTQYMSLRFLITDKKDAQRRLSQINANLENVVKKRSRELEESNTMLMQAEKMASLGELVAGVAHEVNTPIGIGVTAASHLHDSVEQIKSKALENRLTRGELADFMQEAEESSTIILSNLEKAALQIRSFKEVAVDQTLEEKRIFNVCEYLDEIFLSLRPKLKKTSHEIRIDCDKNLVINSYAGVFSQIISNFVTNSLRYGFADGEAGQIKVSVIKRNDRLILEYSDNGRGMEPSEVKKIFDPFFTTGRDKGGTGLGMHIVYNLVTQKLSGTIQCASQPGQGVKFKLETALI